uniref:BED-type domain-containing protein n=3 Tax=Parascaris univalens TaxID=6257 RepID=A0A915A6K7_PARUN
NEETLAVISCAVSSCVQHAHSDILLRFSGRRISRNAHCIRFGNAKGQMDESDEDVNVASSNDGRTDDDCTGNESISVPLKRKHTRTSYIWNAVHENADGTECKFCGIRLKCATSTNVTAHMSRKHPQQLAALRASVDGTKRQRRKRPIAEVMGDEQQTSFFSSDSPNDILRDLLYRYKMGYIGTLRALGNMVENATGRRYAISTLLRKVRKLDEEALLGQKGSIKADDHVLSLNDIRESGPSALCGRRTLSRKLHNTLITLPEQGGLRQYTFVKSSSDGQCEYYRCNNCAREKKRTGWGPTAYIKVQNECVISGKAAQHHPNCEVIEESRALTTAIDRQCRMQIRKGQSLPHNAYKKGFERAVELASLSGSEPGKKLSIAAAFPSWQRVRTSYFRMRREGLKENSTIFDSAAEEADCPDIDRYRNGHTKMEVAPGCIMDDAETAPSRASLDVYTKKEKMESDNVVANVNVVSSSPNSSAEVTEATSAVDLDSSGDMMDSMVSEITGDETVLPQPFSGNESELTSDGHREGAASACSSRPMEERMQQPTSSNTYRRHYLTRDPRTGRITLYKTMPLKTTAEHSVFQRCSSSDKDDSRKAVEGIRLRRAKFLDCSSAGSGVSEDILSAPLSAFIGGKSASLQNTLSYVKAGYIDSLESVKKTDHSSHDECTNIGDSIANCLREVGEMDAAAARQFKNDLIEVVTKYQKATLCKQTSWKR